MAETPRQEEAPDPEQISPEEEERQGYEKHWLNAKTPHYMLINPDVHVVFNNRKLHLFLVGCFNFISDVCPERVIEIAERYADGVATPQELSLMRDQMERIRLNPTAGSIGVAMTSLEYLFRENIDDDLENINTVAEITTRAVIRNKLPEETVDERIGLWQENRAGQADLLRDIFRNPFAKEPINFDPHWRTSDVVDIARGIYEDKDFGGMAVLSDALMDAGCDNEEIIGHCRNGCEHVRGCWVLDLILQKE